MKKTLAKPYSTNKVQKKLSLSFLRTLGWEVEGRGAFKCCRKGASQKSGKVPGEKNNGGSQ